MGVSCSVRLIRQSLPNVCWPQGRPLPGHSSPPKTNTFGCNTTENNHVVVTGQCGGLFQCGNGAVTGCDGKRVCKCNGDPKLDARIGGGSPCHLNQYTKGGHCPPAMPFPPFAPPHPPAPPRPPPSPIHPPHPPTYVSRCDRLCHEALIHRVKDSWCKCSVCRGGNVTDRLHSVDPDVMQQIASGVPCHDGHLLVHNHTHGPRAHEHEPAHEAAGSAKGPASPASEADKESALWNWVLATG